MTPRNALIHRVRSQFNMFDMTDPVEPTQDMLKVAGLERDICLLGRRES